MDKFKIRFRCVHLPKPSSGLSGFEAGKVYDGRSFNGLFEVSPHWGRGGQSKLIGRGTFQEYFEIVNENVLVNQSV